MVRFTGGFLLFTAFSLVVARPPSGVAEQAPLSPSLELESEQTSRKLRGKFLHITDLHPDPFYEIGSSSDAACHTGTGNAGYYGAEKTDCDSPFTLIEATFHWIDENIKDDIDFVVWTGDSARHDNDEAFPRTQKQVIDLNRFVVKQFEHVFGNTKGKHEKSNSGLSIPIVPNLGNNDIVPHNIFEAGPNRWTKEYVDIWKKFVPEEQKHSFARGGWFWVEVIPNKLAVFSLNTLYFFDNNGAVNGCDCESEPGYEHMEWLRIQLEFIRKRGMKAIVSGHVPPARTEGKASWDETCWQKYTLWMRQYRDVVISSLWGHANLDYFMLQDEKDLKYNFKTKEVQCETDIRKREHRQLQTMTNGEEFHTKSTKLLNGLRKIWSNLPRDPEARDLSSDHTVNRLKKKGHSAEEKFYKAIGGEWAERFSLGLGSPSVVPNYFPALRIFEYNITGLEDINLADAQFSSSKVIMNKDEEDEEDEQYVGESKKKKKHKKKKHHHKAPFKVPKSPSSTAPPGPAYSPQTLTFLTMYQYYANLTYIHNNVSLMAGHDGKKAKGMKSFEYKLEYDTRHDGVYSLPDLTVRHWVDLAERMGREKYHKPNEDQLSIEKKKKGKARESPKNHLWRTFVERAFVRTKPEEELEELFG